MKILTFPNPVLKMQARPVENLDQATRLLCEKMLETMYEAPGVGLAASQVGVLKNIIVMDWNFDVRNKTIKRTRDPIVLINPTILGFEGEQEGDEGCLSIPGMKARIRRSDKIKVRYQNMDGLERILKMEGYEAAILQHELDHLDGVLLMDRMSSHRPSVYHAH